MADRSGEEETLTTHVDSRYGTEDAADTETATVSVEKPPLDRIGIDLDGGSPGRPLVLARVAWGSPARRAGVGAYTGWTLVEIDSQPVATIEDVRQAGRGRNTVVLTFTRLRPIEQFEEEEDDASELEDEHPRIVDDDDASSQQRRSYVRRPRGGDSISSKYSLYIWFLLPPVATCMLAVVYSVTVFGQLDDENSESGEGRGSTGGSGTPSQGDQDSETFGVALLGALVVTGAIVAMTFMFVCLYKYNCIKVIMGWLMFSTLIVLAGVAGTWVERFCVRYQIPLDYITFIALMYNFAIVGLICIYFRGHPILTRGYHIASSAVLAWYLTRLPEWTTWILLFVVAVYDIFAVCCGPLKTLVEESQNRNEPIPALVYESRRYKLGLGDFIFYSVLVGRAAVFGYIPWVSSFIAVIMGLCLTLFALATLKQALPALPCSIFLGIALTFSSRFMVQPYAIRMVTKHVSV